MVTSQVERKQIGGRVKNHRSLFLSNQKIDNINSSLSLSLSLSLQIVILFMFFLLIYSLSFGCKVHRQYIKLTKKEIGFAKF